MQAGKVNLSGDAENTSPPTKRLKFPRFEITEWLHIPLKYGRRRFLCSASVTSRVSRCVSRANPSIGHSDFLV